MDNWYEVLQVPNTATQLDIKKAYRRLSHLAGDRPVRHLDEAYATLSDANCRAKYDEGRAKTATVPASVSCTTTVPFDSIWSDQLVRIHVERWTMADDTAEKVYEPATSIYIAVPKGIEDGEIICVPEYGNRIGTKYGDIKVQVQVAPHELYTRKGLNLSFVKQITLKEALCGLTFTHVALNGHTYNIDTKGQVIAPGQTKCLKKLGLQSKESVGDLFITFQIQFPKFLEANIVKQLESLL